MRSLAPLLAVVLTLLGQPARAQLDPALCKQPRTTLLTVRFETGFRAAFVLQREGDEIRGRAQAWQASGVTAGRGSVTGRFAGPLRLGRSVLLEVLWEGRKDILDPTWLQFRLQEGKGEGLALDLGRLVPVRMKAETSPGCARWPEYDSAFCLDYAAQAVSAARESETLGCGHAGDRWSTDETRHLDWCLSRGAEEGPPNAEAAARVRALEDCVARRGAIVPKPLATPADVVAPPPAVPKPPGSPADATAPGDPGDLGIRRKPRPSSVLRFAPSR